MIETAHQDVLLDVARVSVLDAVGMTTGREPGTEELPDALAQPGAGFVTLSIHGRLRGCIGSLVPSRPLVSDVWSNARRTALEDPRFAPLGCEEAVAARLEISVLGPLERMHVADEEALLTQLRPGVDGLLMRLGHQRATFLPKVWQTLPRAEDFLCHLKRKMGVPDDFWDEAMVVSRYSTQEFGGHLVSGAH